MKKSNQRQIVYAFIDSQNLNLGTSKDIFRRKKKIYQGWKLDFRKFRRYLSDKFRVNKAFLLFQRNTTSRERVDEVVPPIGGLAKGEQQEDTPTVRSWVDSFIGYLKQNEEMYKHLQSYGYEIIFKPTVKDDRGQPKGNVDAELVLHSAAIEFPNYDKAVIVSGDGDFRCLHEYLLKNNKLLNILIPNEKNESSLLKPFQKYKTFIVFDRKKLEFRA